VIGRSVRDIVGEDVFETVVKKNLDACFRGETVQYEIKRVYPELGERDLLVGYFPVENPNGINRIVSIIQDITERKRAENALQESEARYRAFFENSIDAVLITSPDGSIQEANAEACRIFGMTREELAGAGRNGVTDPSDQNLAVAIEERTQTGRFKGELNLRRSDGTIFPCEVSSSIFTDEKGFMKTSMIIRDITERKRMMKEREDLVLELQKTLAEVRTLRGILPICASCKRIRDDKGYWNQLEAYIRDHSEAEFSHSLCPECIKKLYPGYGDKPKMG
jgi:PAS domain S-box-containing protein